MAISKFIPTVWGETLNGALNGRYVAVANCNRLYEGDIRAKGDVVKICNIQDVQIGDYTKNTDMGHPQALDDYVYDLRIDQAKYFNFQIDDIDRAQSDPQRMREAMRIAAQALANEADQYVYSLYDEAIVTVGYTDVTSDQILDVLIKARTALYRAGVTDMSEAVIEVPPEIGALILSAKVALSNDNGEALETGCLGSIGGCRVYVSPNIYTVYENGRTHYKCYVRSKRAIAFAEQLSEIEAYRPEMRFADAIKGLHLYGAKVVYPHELLTMDITIGQG